MKVAYYHGLAGLLIGIVIGLSWTYRPKAILSENAESVPVILTEVSPSGESSVPPPSTPVAPNPSESSEIVMPLVGVSHQFSGMDLVSARLAMAFEEIPYKTDGLNEFANAVNQAQWRSPNDNADEKIVMRIQALLNWHHHSVGVIDGKMNANTIKAMQIFQQLNGLDVSDQMNFPTWQKLTENQALMKQPTLVRYMLVDRDFARIGGRSGYKGVSESVGERFHMSPDLLKSLNKSVAISSGNVVTVYNPHQPNKAPIYRVVIKRDQNILYAYGEGNRLVATYPVSLSSKVAKGNYQVNNRILDPVYNKELGNTQASIASGPNSPLGRVWIGFENSTIGIHGSPDPDKIGQTANAGFIQLTNWDALGLFGAVENEAVVVVD